MRSAVRGSAAPFARQRLEMCIRDRPYRLGEDAARPGVVNGAEGGAPAHDEQRSSHDGAVEQHTCERDRSRGEQHDADCSYRQSREKSGVGWRGERHDTVPGEFVPSEDGCPDGPDGGEGPDPHPGEAHLRGCPAAEHDAAGCRERRDDELDDGVDFGCGSVRTCVRRHPDDQEAKKCRRHASGSAELVKRFVADIDRRIGLQRACSQGIDCETLGTRRSAGCHRIGGVHCHDPCCASALCRTKCDRRARDRWIRYATKPPDVPSSDSRLSFPATGFRRDFAARVPLTHRCVSACGEVFRALRSFLFRGPSPRPLGRCAARSCVRIACVLP